MGFKETIEKCFADAVLAAGFAGSGTRLVLEKPRVKEHGDISCPIAMSLAREFKKNPMEIAESITARAVFPPGTVASAEVARPGYINLKIAPAVLVENLAEIRARGESYGSSGFGGGRKCQVEYVSANPTGPLVVVSARAAAVGSSIVNLLRAVGYRVENRAGFARAEAETGPERVDLVAVVVDVVLALGPVPDGAQKIDDR